MTRYDPPDWLLELCAVWTILNLMLLFLGEPVAPAIIIGFFSACIVIAVGYTMAGRS